MDSEEVFNRWLWRCISRGRDNRELAKYIVGIEETGRNLPFEGDVDTCLGELADRLLKKAPSGARVYYVFDEIDKFADMYLGDNRQRELAFRIMWQLRNLIFRENHVGLLFSGSHAARKFFVADSAAPFYNSIPSIHLTPFNLDTSTAENSTRQLVQPRRLAEIYRWPAETLKHMLWVTAGIPYYMKLLAGATYATAQQAQVFVADVNDGLRRMLRKETGLRTVDSLESPGEDELRTLYADNVVDKALIKGVLLSAAYVRSPVGRHAIREGELWSEKSPLIFKANVPRDRIRRALAAALEMGFLKRAESREYELEFNIPILGESLKERFNLMWGGIHGQLERLREGREGDTGNDP
jgi:hypothetical protein